MTCVQYWMGASIVQLCAAAGDSGHSWTVSSLLSLCFCVGLFHFPSSSSHCLYGEKKKMIHRDIEAICNILYGLSEESLLLCFPEIFFFLALFTGITRYTRIHLCIPVCVCVSVLCKIRYTREVKNHSYASCELIWLRWCYLPCK